jgi:hypothetical protein
MEVFMIKICSYCKEFIGEKEPLSDKRTTHTVCDKCFEIAMNEMEDSDEKEKTGCTETR